MYATSVFRAAIRHVTITVAVTVVAGFTAGAGRAAEPSAEADEAALASEARLDVVLRVAAARNPEVLEARERGAAGLARADGAGRLPDLELKGELWGVPLAAPVSFDRAQTLMVGVRQAFPAYGTRAARGRMAAEEAGAAGDLARARALDVAAEVRRAHAEYARADREYRIHLEHVGLLSRLVELARLHYQSGQGSQQDVLRLSLETAELHADVAEIEQQLRSARALLNTLMGRATDAPLGPAPERVPDAAASAPAPAPAPGPDAAALDQRRPELAAAARAVRKGEAALDLARRSASWPSLMVGADYWYTPALPDPHGYGAMLTMGLPWLNPQHAAEVREAEHTLRAERRALEARRNAAGFELRDAAARVEAARQAFLILDGGVLPQARRNFESAQTAYEAGQGTALGMVDALRAYWNVRLQRSRALARLAMGEADYDRAAGLPPAGEGGAP